MKKLIILLTVLLITGCMPQKGNNDDPNKIPPKPIPVYSPPEKHKEPEAETINVELLISQQPEDHRVISCYWLDPQLENSNVHPNFIGDTVIEYPNLSNTTKLIISNITVDRELLLIFKCKGEIIRKEIITINKNITPVKITIDKD